MSRTLCAMACLGFMMLATGCHHNLVKQGGGSQVKNGSTKPLMGQLLTWATQKKGQGASSRAASQTAGDKIANQTDATQPEMTPEAYAQAAYAQAAYAQAAYAQAAYAQAAHAQAAHAQAAHAQAMHGHMGQGHIGQGQGFHGGGAACNNCYVPRLPPHTAHSTQPPGPATPTSAYPYYTTRAPRDFLMANPPSIGP